MNTVTTEKEYRTQYTGASSRVDSQWSPNQVVFLFSKLLHRFRSGCFITIYLHCLYSFDHISIYKNMKKLLPIMGVAYSTILETGKESIHFHPFYCIFIQDRI